MTDEVEDCDPPSRLPDGRPDPEWIRGTCPKCGDDLVSNLYYVAGKGYLIKWRCWGNESNPPTCDYSKTL